MNKIRLATTTSPEGGQTALGVLLALLTFASTAVFAQPLQLVSIADPALEYPSGGGGDSAGPILSSDGRFVLFASSAENLVLVGTNSVIPSRIPHPLNVYLRDRVSGTTTLVSVDPAGLAGGNEDSIPMGVSTNNRYALFESSAGNLVPGDTNAVSDVFVRDLLTASTILVSANTNGSVANGRSENPVISPDGRHVAFVSTANDLVPGDTNVLQDVFVRDLQTGVTRLVSVGATSTRPGLAFNSSDAPRITPDGRFVVFSSTATNLAPGVPHVQSGNSEIYLRDVVAGTTTWASSGAREALHPLMPTNSAVAFNHAVSQDGQFVVYAAARDSHAPANLLRYHVPSGATLVIHTNLANASVSDGALDITPDASRVAFVAYISDRYTTAVMVWDAHTGTITLASEPLVNEIPQFSEATAPVLDESGSYVAFLSNVPGLVTNQIAEGYHAYVRDLESGHTVLADAPADDKTALDTLGAPSLSGDGRLVAFTAPDGTLVPADHNQSYDVFIRDLQSMTNELVSAAHPEFRSRALKGPSTVGPNSCSADGRYIVFRSFASDLVPGDLNGNYDVFVRDLESDTIELISVSTNGLPGNGNSGEPAITPDGRYVVFTSYATDLVPGLSNIIANVFVRDRLAKTTVLASVNSTGLGGGDNDSLSPMISSDGRFVFFYSMGMNLVPGFFYRVNRLYMRDLQTSMTYAVTPARAYMASITPDGRWLACTASSSATEFPFLAKPDRMFVWDSTVARRVYTNSAPHPEGFAQLAISPNGQRIAYATNISSVPYGSHLHALDWGANSNWLIAPVRLTSTTPPRFSASSRILSYVSAAETSSGAFNQVYLYDFETGSNLLVSRSFISGTDGNGHSDSPDISADDRFVAYESLASDLVPGDTNGASDVFLYDRLSGSTTLLSANRAGNASADSFSIAPVFSPDGRMLFFNSWASDLLAQPSDFNNSADVFAYRIYASGDISIFHATVSSTAGGLSIVWPAMPGKTYRVQYKDNLSDAEWRDLPSGVTVLGNRGSLYQPALAAGRFYRVVGF